MWFLSKKCYSISWASPGFRRGAKSFLFRFENLHVAKRHAAHGEAMHIARGFGSMLPREFFLKRCNLVRFKVYFDQILSLFFFKNYHFLHKKINVLDTLLLWGISYEEIFENMLLLMGFGVYLKLKWLFSLKKKYSLFALIYAIGTRGHMLHILKIWCSLMRFGVYFDQIVF